MQLAVSSKLAAFFLFNLCVNFASLRETIMLVNKEAYQRLKTELDAKQVTLVAVSKTKPVSAILELYNLGHRDFGENYVQEMTEKARQLPADIRWHFIGHLQTNKVKQITSFAQLLQGVDSLKLLKEINKQARNKDRVIDCLLQVHIAQEENKFGLDEEELNELLNQFSKESMNNVRLAGLMGMASFTDNRAKVRDEFRFLKRLFDKLQLLTIHHLPLTTLSMGMSNDYKIAVEEGATMVRIGSLLFGEREKQE